MKQYPLPEQINELSKKAKERYVDYHIATKAPFTTQTEWIYEDENGIREYDLEPLSIGEMIEFLDKHDNRELALTISTLIDQDHWEDGDVTNGFDTNNLCDLLWEAVKEILEK